MSFFFKKKPVRVDFRSTGGSAALILVHGFSGDTRETWGKLIDFILEDPTVSTWDVFGLGFPSSLRIDVPGVWAADPEISKIAIGLTTTLGQDPFRKYQSLAIAAHSMGGLVVQRAILDDASVASRVGRVLLFGTPSGGLVRAEEAANLKRQFRDMAVGSPFILELRKDWTAKYGSQRRFNLRVVAGDRDEFVPALSSLEPFEASVRAVVPGNHLEIVKPIDASNQSVRLIIESLTGGNRPLPPVDSARLAVELGQFQKSVDALLPNAAKLDDNAVVTLALALEGTGQGAQALQILETYYKNGTSSSDAMGTLGGRLKRRWLVGRIADDYARALQLYQNGLQLAESNGDFDQAFYHAINIAFLQLMKLPPANTVSGPCLDTAQRALDFCAKCPASRWRLATEGEALLILGQLDKALEAYKQAIAKTRSQREIDSMYLQASQVAARVYGEEGAMKIQQTFGLHP